MLARRQQDRLMIWQNWKRRVISAGMTLRTTWMTTTIMKTLRMPTTQC